MAKVGDIRQIGAGSRRFCACGEDRCCVCVMNQSISRIIEKGTPARREYHIYDENGELWYRLMPGNKDYELMYFTSKEVDIKRENEEKEKRRRIE